MYNRFLIAFLSIAAGLSYVACQKANPAPYSNPQYGLGTQTVTTVSEPSAIYQASVNNGPTINFAPSKAIGNGQVQLIGTTASYTVSVNFPNTTGPGFYFLGSTEGYTATVNNGADTYYVTYHGGGGGNLQIDSIANHKYYGSFSLLAEDNSHNTLNVDNGIFSNL